MLGAIPILALSCGAATSQTSQVLNNQLQLGDVIVGQQLDVTEATDVMGVVTTATGNAVLAGSEGRDMNVRSTQTLQGAVEAHTIVNVGENMGEVSSVTTAASGNTGEAGMLGAVLTGVITQSTADTSISAVGQIEAAEAQAGDLTHSSQAVGNHQGIGLTNSSAGMRITQDNAATVVADGGIILGASSGQATVNGTAIGNNINAIGVEQSSQRLVTSQTSTGTMVQASKFSAYGDSYTMNTNASATGNNLNATNEGPLLDVTSTQHNESYIRGQAEGTSATFSSSAVTAYGAGNSAVVGNYGPEIVLNNDQFNTGGGVEVVSVLDNGTGWDATASSSAVGNAVTGYACAECTGTMTINNNQTNDADIGATTTARMGYGRSISAISSAVGNNASFYVTAPKKSCDSECK